MIKAFLIRQPPDTPAVLVCTAAVGGLCAADQDLLLIPALCSNPSTKQPTNPIIFSRCEELTPWVVRPLNFFCTVPSIRQRWESFSSPTPPTFLAVARRGLFWKVAEPSTTPICTQLPVSLCQPTHWVGKAKANLATSKQEPAKKSLKICHSALSTWSIILLTLFLHSILGRPNTKIALTLSSRTPFLWIWSSISVLRIFFSAQMWRPPNSEFYKEDLIIWYLSLCFIDILLLWLLPWCCFVLASLVEAQFVDLTTKIQDKLSL